MNTVTKKAIWRGWIWLLVLSLASTLAAQWVEAGTAGAQAPTAGRAAPVIGALILALAWLKMRLILTRYLGLAAGSFWGRGFGMVIAGYMTGLLALYLMALA